MFAPLLGRARELEAVVQSLDAARAGAGSAWLVTGEGGIGKSRLCEEIARVAGERGHAVLWGRSWEAGGAPAYWPWIQVLRTLVEGPERLGDGEAQAGARRILARLLPQVPVESGDPGAGGPVDETARFALLDETSRALGAAARQRPLVLLLEDLHASDTASVLLLEFLAGNLHQLPLVLVATYRQSEASRRPVGPLLLRLAGMARELDLRRLDEAEVGHLLASRAGTAVPPELARRVYATTEGNPLFVVETARLLLADSRGHPPGRPGEAAPDELEPIPIPPTIKTALRARVHAVSDPARGVLRAASVIGRDFSRDALTAVLGPGGPPSIPLLAEAVGAGLLLETAPGTYRFSHVLVRETLYQDLPEPERAALHLAAARALPADASFEIAHHLVSAGTHGAEAAETVQACVRAARQALRQLAFDEASGWYSAALAAMDRTSGAPLARADLLIGRGHARLHAGRVAEGKSDCYEAADIARRTGDPDTLARAALECGALYVVAHVDQKLVALLSEALAGLGSRSDTLVARVMARLAAAQQPAPDPNGPIALARRAVEMARGLDDPRALLETIRAAGSTMVDLAPAEERLLLDREHVALATSLGDDAEAFRGSARLVFDCYELGDRLGAQSAIEACGATAERLRHPSFTWRAVALRAMVAMSEGDFAGAEALRTRATELAEAARDAPALGTLGLQRIAQLALQGRDAELLEALPQVERLFAGSPTALPVAQVLGAALLARVGRIEDALLHLLPGQFDRVLALGDRSLLTALAQLAYGMGDGAAAARIRQRLAPSTDHYQHGGLFSMTWGGPTSRGLALLAATEGRWQEAERNFEHAKQRALDWSEKPHAAWAAFDLAAFLWQRHLASGQAPDPRIETLADEALGMARALDMPGLAARAQALLDQARATHSDDGIRAAAAPIPARPAAGPPAATLRLEPDGQMWAVTFRGRRLHLKSGRGIETLARLVAEPGRDFHVLDLVGGEQADPGAVGDRGDSGTLLDDEARAAYRERVTSLRQELQEAEDNHDRGRAEALGTELAFLTEELGRAVGLGGRQRRAGSAVERARINVQRRIRETIRKLTELDPTLGRFLDRSVRTGAVCRYDPE